MDTKDGEYLAPFPCPICPERFNHLADKKRHIKDNHSDAKKKGRR